MSVRRWAALTAGRPDQSAGFPPREFLPRCVITFQLQLDSFRGCAAGQGVGGAIRDFRKGMQTGGVGNRLLRMVWAILSVWSGIHGRYGGNRLLILGINP